MKEIKSLEEKKAIRRLTPQDVAYYRREHSDKLEIVPGKAIHSIKAPDARKKCRLSSVRQLLSVVLEQEEPSRRRRNYTPVGQTPHVSEQH